MNYINFFMKHTFLILIFGFLAASCSNSSNSHIQLKDFVDDVSVQKLGQELIDLPYGLNALESGLSESEEILVAVHGSRSQGYEWVYPLKSINSSKKEMYFYRWFLIIPWHHQPNQFINLVDVLFC